MSDQPRRRPHVRTALPWLRSGPLWRVHEDAWGELDDFLGRSAYLRVELDGRAMTSRAATHAEIGRAFRFPDWYGNSWDAFNDCMHGFVSEHDGELVAVVWRHLDATAAAAPATAAEVGWALLDVKFGGTPAQDDRPGARRYAVDVDVFGTGSGPDFDRPDIAPSRTGPGGA